MSSSKRGSTVNSDEDWFSMVFGFPEPDSYDDCQKAFTIKTDNDTGLSYMALSTTSKISEAEEWCVGKFDTPSLDELRTRNSKILEEYNKAAQTTTSDGVSKQVKPLLTFKNVRADIQDFHFKNPEYKFSTIQVASQFNCLEMISLGIPPENGITNYVNDKTQGPACCVCTLPAIYYRNYLHEYKEYQIRDSNTGKGVKSLKGQRMNLQCDNLLDLSDYIGNKNGKYFQVKGGYTVATKEELRGISWDKIDFEVAKGKLRVGLHEDIQCTAGGGWGTKLLKVPKNCRDINAKDLMLVNHVLSSATAISYNRKSSPSDWEPLSKLILQATYEATFYSAMESLVRHKGANGSKKVLLTMVGGGVFGNKSIWIREAVKLACIKFRNVPLEVIMVNYQQVDKQIEEMSKNLFS